MKKEEVGAFLQKLREQNNITIEELERRTCISSREIKKWESGKKLPSMSDLELLSFNYDISVNEILSCKRDKQKDDDMVFAYSQDERKYKKIKLIVIIAIILSLVGIICFLSFSKNNKDKINIYKIYGESESFYYSNAMFISSNIKNIYVYGNITIKDNNIKEEDITDVRLKSNDRLIVASNTLPNEISIENYGYDELFPKDVVSNLDNWVLEITYSINDEKKTETINLKNEYVMNKVKVQPISDN